MKKCNREFAVRKSWILQLSACLLAGAMLLQGCGSSEKEPTPLVTVQVTPAKSGPIELEVSSDAVVYPLEQAMIAPKITSTIAKFYVQRGSKVKKGQLLAQLENADLGASGAEQGRLRTGRSQLQYHHRGQPAATNPESRTGRRGGKGGV